MKNADMPAMPVIDEEQSFPVDMERYGSKEATLRFAFGMNKREMIAMHIFSSMQGRDGVCNIEHEVRFAVVAADHLLAELENTK